MLDKHDFGAGAGISIIGVILLAILSPVLTFACAYFGGWILKLFVGTAITNGLNLLFDTERFTPDFVPLACATLATIGKYFKSSQTNKTEK